MTAGARLVTTVVLKHTQNCCLCDKAFMHLQRLNKVRDFTLQKRLVADNTPEAFEVSIIEVGRVPTLQESQSDSDFRVVSSDGVIDIPAVRKAIDKFNTESD